MRITTVRHLAVGFAMLAGASLAFALIPRAKVADQGPRIDLATMIPSHFGEWNIDTDLVPIQPDPQTKKLINSLYSQTLTRTYINNKGVRIMLSVAYGGEQTDELQVHKPEVCYRSQGFQIRREYEGRLNTGTGNIRVRRLLTVNGSRIEPVTYWMTIGEKIAFGKTATWKLEQLKYGLTGQIPDGLLFRVSNLSPDEKAAFTLQDGFVRELLRAVSPAGRTRLIGQSTL